MNKINIAEILKDCPKGMKLSCTMYEDVYFDYVDELNIIHCYIQHETYRTSLTFNQHGTPNSDIKSKCVIFPKDKTTWEGFQRPFEDGDVVAYDNPFIHYSEIFIFKDKKENNTLSNCYLMLDGDELDIEEGAHYVTRLATEEEKAKLFQAIKDNGYKWNAKTKTLEKLIEPKFKVGDRIRSKNKKDECFYILNIDKDRYKYTLNIKGYCLEFKDQDNYELVPNKFDITTLKPFDKVLVRDTNEGKWKPRFWGFYDIDFAMNYPYECCGTYAQCIPYEENKHLLGTADDCTDFYKIWK